MISHVRNLKPTLHNARIGEPFYSRNFLAFTHSGGVHLKDLSSARNSASADTEPALVATLSNVFERQCKFKVFWIYILATSLLIASGSTSSAPQSFHIGIPLPREERRAKLRPFFVSTILASLLTFIFVHFLLPLLGKFVTVTQPPAIYTGCPSDVIAANADIVGIGVSPCVFLAETLSAHH